MAGADRSLFDFTARRPVAIGMVIAAAVVFGLVGLYRLPVNLLPDISYPTVTVRTAYPGASPRDVEERVSERIQESVSVISGVRRVVSVSRPEVSDVVLEFEWGTQMVFAMSDIRDRLDRVQLPDEAEAPLVLRYDPSLDPVMTVGLFGELEGTALRRIAEEEVERELAEIEGVAAVKVRGGDEEEIRISLDDRALALFGIDVATVGQRLAAENVNAASGAVEEGKTQYLVRLIGEFTSVETIEQIVLERRGEASIRLGQVADVRRAAADKQVVSIVGGQPAVLIDVYKEATANIVALCAAVRDRLYGDADQQAYVAAGTHLDAEARAAQRARARADSETVEQDARAAAFAAAREVRAKTDYLGFALGPLGVQVDTLQDQSRFIENAVDDVLGSAVKGGLFAIAVLYLFLRRLSATAILAVSIPVSVVATFAPMFVSDIDLNIMSLGGLALGIGMLVDNSIVVLESIARAREEGLAVAAAAVTGVRRVATAVIASTLTTVAVFFPIVFVEGVAGQLFRDQALTVVYSLLMSLLVALFVIPMLASRGAGRAGAPPPPPPRAPDAHRPAGAPRWLALPLALPQLVGRGVAALLTRIATVGLRALLLFAGLVAVLLELILWPFATAFDWLYRGLQHGYPRLLSGALRARALVVLTALALLAVAVTRIPHLGNEMLPEVHQGEFYVEAFLPRKSTVERTAAVMADVETAVAALPDVERTFLAAGVDDEELNDSDEGEHSARLLVKLRPAVDRPAQEARVRADIDAVIRRTPEVTHRYARPSVLSFEAPLVVEVLGEDLLLLRQASAAVAAALAEVPGLREVRSSLQRGSPELAVRFDRERLAAVGLDPKSVTDVLRAKIQGDVPTRYAERERKIDIRVRLDRRQLRHVGELMQLNVNPAGRPEIPLRTVGSVVQEEGPSEIRRIGNLRGAEVQATLRGFDLGTTQERVLDALAALDLPRGIDVRLGGQKEELEQSTQSLSMALLLAVFLVYIVMASQFESLRQPLIILCALPLALVGVIFTLDALTIPLSVIVFLGAIVLAGIVVNNAIILLDQINRLRADGVPRDEAILRGAQTRLRPVLMTTATTVLGLLPLTGWLGALPVLGGGTEGVELRGPMAVTVISGLLSSTLLTLVVIPVIYSLTERRS